MTQKNYLLFISEIVLFEDTILFTTKRNLYRLEAILNKLFTLS